MPEDVRLIAGALCICVALAVACERTPDAITQYAENPWVKGDVAFRHQDFATALALYRTAATRGDPVGQYKLGLMYYWGHAVPQDYLLALEWLRKAAEQGNAEGQYNLGQLFLNGEGVTRDTDKAAQWLELAAAQGHRKAQEGLDWIAAASTDRITAGIGN